MNKIDNAPRIIVSFPRNWGLSASNEIWAYEFKFERIDNTIRLVNTGENIGIREYTRFNTYDWLKNLFVPWMLDRYYNYFEFIGPFRGLFVVEWNKYIGNIENSIVYLHWENLDFVLVRVIKSSSGVEYSPWGPIHLLIVLGALVYVRKRWH